MNCGHVVVDEKKIKLKSPAFTVGKPDHIFANIQIRHVDVSYLNVMVVVVGGGGMRL